MSQKSFTSILLKSCIFTHLLAYINGYYRCVSYYFINFTFGSSLFFSLFSSAKPSQTHHLLPPLIHTNTNTPTQTHKTCKTATTKTQIPQFTQHRPTITIQPLPPPKPVKTTETQNTTKIKPNQPKIHRKSTQN